jgi:hypothetical protein
VHVCELYPTHDEGYEKMLASKRARDYEHERFTPWSRPSELPPGPSTDEQWAVEQAQKFARLRDRCLAFERRAAEAEEQALRVVALEDDVAAAETRLAAAEADRRALALQVEEARASEHSLRDEAMAAVAAAERVRQFASKAGWLGRLRFLITGRIP